MNQTAIKLRDLILASEGRTLEDELVFGCRVTDKLHQFFGKSDPHEMTLVDGSPEYADCDGYWFTHFRGNPTVHFTLKEILNKDNFEILGQPITLNRLLVALGKKKGVGYGIRDTGTLIKSSMDYRGVYDSIEITIDLTHTNILDNDEPTLAKLVDLLTKK